MTEKTGHFAQMLSFIANSDAAKVSVIVNKIILLLIVAVTTTRGGGLSRNDGGVVENIWGQNSLSRQMFSKYLCLYHHII